MRAEPAAPDPRDARLCDALCRAIDWGGLERLGVAVSGGSDSMALLQILARCARDRAVPLEAASVDHGLRPAAAEEAAFVKDTCKALDCQHETLRWQGWDGHGNLQAEARRARYGLLAGWAGRRGLTAVALGHTGDDQAETFVMRLAREAGVDGLATMERRFIRQGVTFLRPALGLGRAELRGFLTRQGLSWCDDPSNADDRFDRVKARKALAALAPLGIDAGTLAAVSDHMAAARAALAVQTAQAAAQLARVEAGDVLFDRAGVQALPGEIRRRLTAAALAWVAGGDYPPRRAALAGLARAVAGGETHTLHGCRVTSDGCEIRIAREYNAVAATTAPFGTLWDGRWRVTGPATEVTQRARGAGPTLRALGAGLTLRALGAAIGDCPDWRQTGLPRASLMATPAVWDQDRLVAAPLAGRAEGYAAEIAHPRGDFVASLLAPGRLTH